MMEEEDDGYVLSEKGLELVKRITELMLDDLTPRGILNDPLRNYWCEINYHRIEALEGLEADHLKLMTVFVVNAIEHGFDLGVIE